MRACRARCRVAAHVEGAIEYVSTRPPWRPLTPLQGAQALMLGVAGLAGRRRTFSRWNCWTAALVLLLLACGALLSTRHIRVRDRVTRAADAAMRAKVRRTPVAITGRLRGGVQIKAAPEHKHHTVREAKKLSLRATHQPDRSNETAPIRGIREWTTAEIVAWLRDVLSLPMVADGALREAVDGSMAVEMQRSDWVELGASGLKSAKLITEVRRENEKQVAGG